MAMQRSRSGTVHLALLLIVVMAGTMVECNALPQSSVSVSKEQRSKPETVPEEAGDDYNDDYDDDDLGEDSPEATQTTDGGAQVVGTKLLTKNYVEKAPPGEQVSFRCEVSNPTEQTIIIWYKNNQPIFQHHTRLTSDKRFTMKDNFSLQIDGVQLPDEGFYSCQLLPSNMTVKIELQIMTPPRNVHIMHGSKVVNETIELNQRDRKFVLFCSATGHPTPQINWSYRGRHLDEEYSRQIGIVPRKEFIEIHEVKPRHAGDYECLAQNGVGEPVSQTVTVLVRDDDSAELESEMDEGNSTVPVEKGVPTIHKHATYVNTAIGETVELTCQYDSNPAPRKVQWFRDSEVMSPSGNHIVNDHHGHHDRTRLTLKGIQQKDLVSYFCKIENDIGEASAKTILGLNPGPAHLVHSNYSDGLLHTWWKIHSMQQISEMQVHYRGENTKYAPVNAEISSTDQNYDDFTWTVRKSIRLPEGQWYVTARARNTEGWSIAESVPHQFQIPSRSTNARDNIQLSSVGGAGASPAHRTSPSAALLSSVLGLLLLVLTATTVKSVMY